MNTLTFSVLRLLSDGKFHSGEAIAKHFRVSRTSVWNALQDAESLGVEIFSVRGRGYKLPRPICLLDEESVRKARQNHTLPLHLEIHDHLCSTNAYVMQNLLLLPHASCIAANLQSQGRGRRGRHWQTGLGTSLTFSLLWRFESGASALSGLSLAVGVGAMRALKSLQINNAKLKWPNDILVDNAKLAGILIELQGDMDGPSHAVIGIGMNLHLPDGIKQQIDQPVTDLSTLNHAIPNANLVLAVMLDHLTEVLDTFQQHGFKPFSAEWQAHHAYHGQAVRMLMPDGREIAGIVEGVGEDGSLLVRTDRGSQRFISGEISLRGA